MSDPKQRKTDLPASANPDDDWKLLLIVTPGLADQYEYLSKAFQGREWATVIIDRRHGERRRGERRQTSATATPGRRKGERRRWKDVDEDLLMRGWAHVWVRATKPPA